MAAHRPHPFRIGLLFAAISVGGWLVATPEAQQDRGKQGGVPMVALPTVTVPSVKLPRVVVPMVAVPRVPRAGFPPTPPVSQLPVSPQSLDIPADQLAAYAEAARLQLLFLPGQVLVKFKDGLDTAGQKRALMAVTSAPNVAAMQWIGEVAVLKDASQPDATILAQQLSAQPEVAYAEPNYLRRLHSTPNDPSFASRQWNMAAINMPRAWDIAQGGSAQVIVAVLDSGVTSIPVQSVSRKTWNGSSIVTFSMLVGPSPDFDLSRFVNARDFTVSVATPPSTVIDSSGHGSHVAGTVGENTNNGIALAGIAYGVKIMPLKVCTSYWDLQFSWSNLGLPGYFPTSINGTCDTAAIAAAIRFAADNGAKVINMSLGGTTASLTERDAINYAVARGVFIAMSNGNEFEDGNPINYPAAFAKDINGAMSVAATNRLNRRAFYSSTGAHTEIAAPGGDSREGNVIWQATICSSDSNRFSVIFPKFDRYCEEGPTATGGAYQGTSMASPHVAGVAALLVSRGITDPATIEGVLRRTARDLGTPGRDNEFGFGLIQAFAALFGLGGGR